MTFLTSSFDRAGAPAPGCCLIGSPHVLGSAGVLGSLAASDAIIAAAFVVIPIALLRVVRRRNDPSLNSAAGLFGGFFLACAMIHLLQIRTLWHPDDTLRALLNVITAGLAIGTVLALRPLWRKALDAPTVAQLQEGIRALQNEMQKRRSVEDHLLDVEQSLAVALASIGAGYISTDREGRVTGMNAVAERVTGWSTAEAVGHDAWEVFDREARPESFLDMTPVEAFMQLGYDIAATHHVVAVSRSGERTPLELKGDLTRDAEGSVRGLVWIFRDVSRLVHAETEANRLAAIVESTQDAIISVTLDGVIRSWNPGAQAMLGYSQEEAIGRKVEMIIPPDRVAEELRILAELSVGRRVPAFDTVRVAKGGERLDVSLTVSPIRDSRGVMVGGAKIARNVTEQRRAEAALGASQLRLRFLLDAAQIGEWETDLVTGVVLASQQHDRCFGYESMGPTWSASLYMAHIHPDDRDLVARSTRLRLTARTEWSYQCRVIWPDGSVHWIRVNGATLFEEDRPVRCVGIIADITQWKQAEEASLRVVRLEAENTQIQEANRLKTRFLANMSHELRTPLNAIIGFSDLLYMGAVGHDSPKYNEFLGHIRASSHHLLQLINDVLDLSKVEAGKLAFVPQPIMLPAIVKDVTDIMAAAAEKKNITLVVDIDPKLPQLFLDPARLKQVLFNYLSNAIKFTPDDGTVSVRARREGSAQVHIEVEDTGIGIASADLPRLFCEFEQLDRGVDRRHQGTGLGLALTRRLVEAQGGRVGVTSDLGRGSVFFLVLNLVQGAEPSAVATKPQSA